jgi:hypothetical protein
MFDEDVSETCIRISDNRIFLAHGCGSVPEFNGAAAGPLLK